MKRYSKYVLLLLLTAFMVSCAGKYVTADEKTRSATAAADGTLKWTFSTGGAIHSSPAIGPDGEIVVGSDDGKVYIINPNGTLKCAYTTSNKVWSSPVIGPEGTVYVGSDDNSLYAIQPNCTLKWSFLTGQKVISSPALGADGTIYVGSLNGKLYAINPDGSQKWAYQTGSAIWSCPAIDSDGAVYVGSYDKKLYAIKADGTLKWAYSIGYAVRSSPAIGSDGTVYVGAEYPKLYAINPNGTLKWEFTTQLGEYTNSSAAIGSDGTIYVGSNDNHLYAINPDGTKKWDFLTYGDVFSSPAVSADGTVYVGSGVVDKLHAVRPDGTEKWSIKTGSNVWSSPVIGADGTVYVGSSDNKVYAINTSSEGLADSPWPMFRHDVRHTARQTSKPVWSTAIYSKLFKNTSDVAYLRKYRDNVLIKTAVGEQYTNQLYASSGEALQVLINNRDLLSRARKLIAKNKDAVIDVANGGHGVIADTDEVLAFLDDFADKSPPQLENLAQRVKREMLKKRDRGREFFGFNLPHRNQIVVARCSAGPATLHSLQGANPCAGHRLKNSVRR